MANAALLADNALIEDLAAAPPLRFAALPGVVLHLVSLAQCAERQAELACCLSPDERRRAAAITHGDRRTAFVASRALLRQELSTRTGHSVPASAWKIGTSAHGKPFVRSPQGLGVGFSLSYTSSLLALALAPGHELGVDIEALVPQGGDEVPWQVLTSAERRFLHTLPDLEQFPEFLRLWTLKEAYTKYLGLGATLDFRRVEVNVDRLQAAATSTAETRLPEPMITQQVLSVEGRDVVLALAAGKTAAARFVPPAGEAVTLLRRF